EYAAVLCGIGDREGYRQLTRQMFDRFGKNNSRGDWEAVVMTLTFGQEAGVDTHQIAESAQGLWELGKKGSTPSIHHSINASYAFLNAGSFDEAARFANLMIGTPQSMGVLSIVEQHRGNRDVARRWLDQLGSSLDSECRRILESPPQSPVNPYWTYFPEIHTL